MFVLLDTCAALWIMENEWLRPEAVAAIDDAYDRGEAVRVSPITGWEIGLSAARARASAASPHGCQSTGLFACCKRYGLVSPASAFTCRDSDCARS